MVTATITSKGQIMIPKAVRDSLHLRSGDRVAFFLHGDGEAMFKPLTKSVDEVYGRLHRAGQTARSIEDMDEAVAKHVKDRQM